MRGAVHDEELETLARLRGDEEALDRHLAEARSRAEATVAAAKAEAERTLAARAASLERELAERRAVDRGLRDAAIAEVRRDLAAQVERLRTSAEAHREAALALIRAVVTGESPP